MNTLLRGLNVLLQVPSDMSTPGSHSPVRQCTNRRVSIICMECDVAIRWNDAIASWSLGLRLVPAQGASARSCHTCTKELAVSTWNVSLAFPVTNDIIALPYRLHYKTWREC